MDTRMYLKDSNGIDITDQSYNLCGGNNCWVPEVCTTSHAETIVMKKLSPDQYRLELFAVNINTSNPFQVHINCGDFSNLTRIWDSYHCDDPTPLLSDTSTSYMGCNSSITAHLSCGETKTFVFWLFQEDNVVFETCGSNIDTRLYLYNASENTNAKIREEMQTQSINQCDGDDCHWTTVNNRYCDSRKYPESETIPMRNLPAGVYYLDLSAWSSNEYGEYNLQIHCGVDLTEPCNGTLPHCNYVQLGIVQGELKELPYPFDEYVQDGAVYPIGYCFEIKGISFSFRFKSVTGRVFLQTFDGSNTCSMYLYDTATYSTMNTYSNISGMVFVFVFQPFVVVRDYYVMIQ